MEPARIMTGCITGLIALAMAVYISFTARKKGPIFSNTYIWGSKAEREKADRNAEYRLVTVVFGSLSAAFAFMTGYVFTYWGVLYLFMWLALLFAAVYAVVSTVKKK